MNKEKTFSVRVSEGNRRIGLPWKNNSKEKEFWLDSIIEEGPKEIALKEIKNYQNRIAVSAR